MLKLSKPTILLAGLIFAQALALPAFAQAQNVGVVDKVKLYSAYPRLKSAADEIKKDEERIHKLIETSNKQFDEAKKSKKPEAELNALHKSLQTKIDSEFKTFQNKALNMEKALETELDNAIKAEATAKSVTTVLDKSAVLLGGTDITDGVSKRLAASPTVTGSADAQTK